MGERWTCDRCQEERHDECLYVLTIEELGRTENLICDCPCEPFPLPGFPDEQPRVRRRR